MGVNLRGVEPHVAQHGLDVANICTAFEHQRRQPKYVLTFRMPGIEYAELSARTRVRETILEEVIF